ncbi:MAG TPA: NifU family protein [Sedimentisphaerales bacterium]|nr:NifU family protein [Sedimentisphaerales bacterium]
MCDACGCSHDETELSLEERVKDTIETIRGGLQSHGGDVELIGIDEDNTVRVRLQGACQGCPGATMTMKMGIERILRERVPEIKEVVAVN